MRGAAEPALSLLFIAAAGMDLQWQVMESQCQEGDKWRFSSGRGFSCWLSSLSSTGLASWVLQRNKENPTDQYFAYLCGREGLNARSCTAIRLQEG